MILPRRPSSGLGPALGALAVTLVLCVGAPRLAVADDNDLVLSRLGLTTADDGNIPMGTVIPDNRRFRALASELGVALAPRFAGPADSLGFSGFNFSADTSFTTIDSGADYWCATEKSSACTPGAVKGSGALTTVGLFVRKGIWLPLPSFEFGAGALHLLSSRMWAAQAYAKFAVHEGFHDWPIPSLAVRGAASRLMGSPELDLTVASLDVSASKSFGIGGVANLSPYLGWNVLWIVPRSEVIDKTPNIDAFTEPTDVTSNFVFEDQDTVLRQRLFGGLKVKYYVFALTLEAGYTLSGSSVDDRSGTDADCASVPATMKDRCDAADSAPGQASYTFSLAMDF
jgi:hypothetical protein